MNVSTADVQARVCQAVARALHSSGELDPAGLRMGTTPGWDSMGHMNVVMEVEREFGITFPVFRLPELVDVSSIVRALQPERAHR